METKLLASFEQKKAEEAEAEAAAIVAAAEEEARLIAAEVGSASTMDGARRRADR